jgi:hypothetical protein
MECWKDGKMIVNQNLISLSKTQCYNIPVFHHSSIPEQGLNTKHLALNGSTLLTTLSLSKGT